MSPIALLMIAVVSLSLAVLAWLSVIITGRQRSQMVNNLKRDLYPEVSVEAQALETEEAKVGRLTALAFRLTRPSQLRLMERLLVRAGRPPAWPLDRLVVTKLVGAVLFGLLGLLFIFSNPSPLTLLIALLLTVLGYFLPEILLYNTGIKRNERIGMDLADTLDQMTIAVEAGLGFESAMARAGRSGNGPLADELTRTVQDIQVGQVRREAYESLTKRTDATDLRRFIRAVLQADEYGIAIGDVLRTQAGEMRLKRRQRAEEKAQQIPVKVIFPLMVCILPVLFIVLLGPTVLNVIDTFSDTGP